MTNRPDYGKEIVCFCIGLVVAKR